MVIVADFAENPKSNVGPHDLDDAYYKTIPVTLFGVCVCLNGVGPIFLNYFSRCANKSSEVACYLLARVMTYIAKEYPEEFDSVSRVSFWFDCGPSFRSYMTAWMCMDYFPRAYTDIGVWVFNVFCEKHGRQIVDMDFKRVKQYIVAYTDAYKVKNAADLARAVIYVQERAGGFAI